MKCLPDEQDKVLIFLMFLALLDSPFLGRQRELFILLAIISCFVGINKLLGPLIPVRK